MSGRLLPDYSFSIPCLSLAVNFLRAFRRFLVPMHYCLKCKKRLFSPGELRRT